MKGKKDTAGVIAPPPLIFFIGLLLGGLAAWRFPFAFIPSDVLAQLIGSLLIMLGLAIILIAWIQMKKAKTNIEPWQPTTAIIDSGLYGISRNPIYLAMIFGYLGISLWFNSVWFLPFLPLCVIVIHFGVILREERYLEGKFGEEYLDYKNRVRRWI